MLKSDHTRKRPLKPYLWLIAFIGVIVPRRLRADWRQEWEAELQYRETLIAQWGKLDRRNKLALLWRSVGAFVDALWLQPKRLEDEMFQDLRFGARMLRTHKGFTAVAVLSLALGIGANTAIFSLADALLWRALPATNNDRLFTLVRGDGGGGVFSYPDYVDYRDRNQVFVGLAAYEPVTLAFGNGDRSGVVMGELVTGNFFEVLGVRMAQGRAFLPEEDRTPGAHPVVVVSHDFWRLRFGGDPQLVGKTVTFNNHSFTVIGIAAEGFAGLSIPIRADVWVPMMMQAAAKPTGGPGLNDRQVELLRAIAQLKAGVSRAQAEAELETINRQLQQAYPAPNSFNLDAATFQQSRRLTLAPAQGTLLPILRQMVTLAATLAAVVAGIVLLIACANVANLLLARAATRRREIAIRLAVGASRLRLIRQLLTESLLLALLGAAAGLLLALWINQLLMSVLPAVPPPMEFKADLRLDGRAFGFTLLLSMLTGVIFGLAPAWAATRPDVVPALKDETGTSGGRRWFSLRNLLVVAQVALSLVLLIGEVIGRHIRIGPDPNAPWSVIVGVAGDCKYSWLREEQRIGIWEPPAQTYSPSFQALARTATETPNIVAAIRREVAAIDPNLPVQNIITLREQVGLQLWAAEMSAGLVTTLGGLGLLLAAIGLYGVMSYAVARRTREIGIRMALGAQARDMLKMVIGQGLRLTLAGVAIGLALAMAVARLVANLLYGVSARDPITFVVVPLALAAVAWLACYVPARRATKVDPLLAIRHE